MSIVLTVRVDDAAVLRGLREQRRAIKQDIKRLSGDAARRRIVPRANAIAPSPARGTLISRPTTRGPYLTTSARGTRRATVGLLNFGGVVRDPIFPVFGKALRIGDRFVSSVRTPRFYKPMGFIQRGVRLGLPAYRDQIEVELAKLINSRIAYTRSFGTVA